MRYSFNSLEVFLTLKISFIIEWAWEPLACLLNIVISIESHNICLCFSFKKGGGGKVGEKKEKVWWQLLVHARSLTPRTVAHHAHSVHGILQARTLEWLPCPPPGDLLTQGRNPRLLCLPRWQAVLAHWAIWEAADTWWQLMVCYPSTSSLHFFALWSWNWTCKPFPLAGRRIVGRGTRVTLQVVWSCHPAWLFSRTPHAPPVPAHLHPAYTTDPLTHLPQAPASDPSYQRGGACPTASFPDNWWASLMPVPCQWKGGVLTTGQPGNSLHVIVFKCTQWCLLS